MLMFFHPQKGVKVYKDDFQYQIYLKDLLDEVPEKH